jgi:hypothetical protein
MGHNRFPSVQNSRSSPSGVKCGCFNSTKKKHVSRIKKKMPVKIPSLLN